MRKSLVIVPVALVLVAVGGAAIVFRTSPAVPEGTFVAGVAVGGLDGERLRAAIEGPVRAKVEQTLTVTAGDASTRISPAELGLRLDVDATVAGVERTWLRWSPDRRRDVTPVVTAGDGAQSALDDDLKEVRRAAKNSSVRLAAPAQVLDGKGDLSYTASDRGVTVVAGEPGQGVQAAAGVREITAAMRDGRTAVTLPVVAVAPGDDTPKLAGVDQLIGTFTTYHPCCAPRVGNIHRISEIVDGTVIGAGKTFSLNDTAGERTAARGFVPAPAIVDGELEDQLGGGVSQFSTTLFNAAWFAGLDIREHQPHSLYISRYPPGREATLDWRSIDQVIRNDTSAPVVIRVRTTATSITVGLYGHTGDRVVASETGEREPRENGGFAIRVQRTVRQDGAVRSTDTLRWTYRGLD